METEIVVVGLNNPGEEYEDTRHNIGAEVVKKFAEKNGFSAWRKDTRMQARVCQGNGVLLALPTTFMNKSGESVAVIMKENPNAKLIVVHDDIDLPLGEVKVSLNRGAGGHNGVQNIIDRLGTKDFTRLRIGIIPTSLFGNLKKPKGEGAVSKFVVGKFNRRERNTAEKMIEESTERILEFIKR